MSEMRRIWGAPLAVAALSASGLFSALVLDGWGDAWSWLALGVPVAIGGCCLWPRSGVAGRDTRLDAG